MLTREQVAGCRATIKSDPNPGRRWRESIFVAALDSIDFLESRIAQLEAALAAATVTVPVEVVEAAKYLDDWHKGKDIHHVWYKLDQHKLVGAKLGATLALSNFILSLAAKGKGGA